MAMTRDCKSLAFGLRRFESYFQHHIYMQCNSTDSFFESSPTSSTIFTCSAIARTRSSNRVLLPAPVAVIAQLVERIHGKDEVTSSNLVDGSIFGPGH